MSNEIVFFFSALGAFNGFILSIYFGVTAKTKVFSNYFLAFLLLTISIRVTKSVFFYYNPYLSNIFIQLGLSACILIGPFLYLYLRTVATNDEVQWKYHTIPWLLFVLILGFIYPYFEYRFIWNPWIIQFILTVWLIYHLLSYKFIFPILDKLIKKRTEDSIDNCILSIYDK